MLEVTIRPDGGVTIAGTRRDLRVLAHWLTQAAITGQVNPAFMSDTALTSFTITRIGNGDAVPAGD